MKYKGIELKEFESEKPVLFDPPKRMLVWDYDDEIPTEEDVIAFIPNRYHKVIEQMSVSIHCAEIPEVVCRRATNREIAKWLAEGNGEVKYENTVFPNWNYWYNQENCIVKNSLYARKWCDKEWHEPTREYLGLED